MNSEDWFFTWVWIIGGTVVISTAITIALYHGHKNNMILQAIQHGVNPIEVACAFDGKMDGTCVLRAVK
jgi:hypothetical protein